MKDISWNQLKSERLKKTRGVSFEEIIASELIAVKSHQKRADQNIMLFLSSKAMSGLFLILKKKSIYF